MADKALEFQARGGYGKGGGGGYGGGGYGGGGYGGGGYGDTNEYVDPYVVLASLGFGVFLFNLIYALLNRSARSIDVVDMNLPLQLSDRPEAVYSILKNTTRSVWDEEKSWSVDSRVDRQQHSSAMSDESSPHRLSQLMEHSWRMAEAIRRDPASCSRTLLCRLGSNDAIAWNRLGAGRLAHNTAARRAIQLYVSYLAQHYGEEDVSRYVDQLETDAEAQRDCGSLPDVCENLHLMTLF